MIICIYCCNGRHNAVMKFSVKVLCNVRSYHIYYTTLLYDKIDYFILITDTTLELSVFWPSDTESWINELRFSESISLSFKMRLTSVTCFCGDVT